MEELPFNIRGQAIQELDIYKIHNYAKYSIILTVVIVLFIASKNFKLSTTKYIKGKTVLFV